MECKYSHTECFMHIITVDFEELRACDLGVTCNPKESVPYEKRILEAR